METVELGPVFRVLCVDDHPLVRKGIASILANEADMELVGEASASDADGATGEYRHRAHPEHGSGRGRGARGLENHDHEVLGSGDCF